MLFDEPNLTTGAGMGGPGRAAAGLFGHATSGVSEQDPVCVSNPDCSRPWKVRVSLSPPRGFVPPSSPPPSVDTHFSLLCSLNFSMAALISSLSLCVSTRLTTTYTPIIVAANGSLSTRLSNQPYCIPSPPSPSRRTTPAAITNSSVTI